MELPARTMEPRVPTPEPERMTDASGKIIAVNGLIPLEPWVVKESRNFSGEQPTMSACCVNDCNVCTIPPDNLPFLQIAAIFITPEPTSRRGL